MKNIEGFELSKAIAALNAEGIQAQTLEVSSRKGVDGNEKRVVRAMQTGEGTALITWAWFKTRVDAAEDII